MVSQLGSIAATVHDMHGGVSAISKAGATVELGGHAPRVDGEVQEIGKVLPVLRNIHICTSV